MRWRLTVLAERDVEGALRTTLDLFGPRQLALYAALIDTGIEQVAQQPAGPATSDRAYIGAGVRSFHLELAAGRRGSAAHEIYYRVQPGSDGQPELVILRLLHEAMDPGRRVGHAIRGDITRS